MKEGFESLGRVRLQGITLLAVTFVVGALAGMAGERIRAQRTQPFSAFPPRAGEVPRPYERLDLTDEQRDRIDGILAARRVVTDSLMRGVFPRLRAMTDSIRLEIREVLTAEQREKLEKERGEFGRPGFGPPGARGMPPGGRRGPSGR